MARENVVSKLVNDARWAEGTAKLAERAGYRCEYCGLDLLASTENYKLWQGDHIVPKKHGGTDDPDNLALACLVCNFKLKGFWDPRSSPLEDVGRDELLRRARAYIQGRRDTTFAELQRIRLIVGYQSEI